MLLALDLDPGPDPALKFQTLDSHVVTSSGSMRIPDPAYVNCGSSRIITTKLRPNPQESCRYFSAIIPESQSL